MSKPFYHIVVPAQKYRQAAEFKKNLLQRDGVRVPLWFALSESEKQRSVMNNQKQFDKMVRRFL